MLTHRVAHLIRDLKISPFAILAITFTNKAADEMKERVGQLVGPVAQKMWVSTFHSACARILRREAAHLGMRSSFSIYDQADAVRLTGYILRDMNLDPKRLPPRQIHAAISAAKNELIGPKEMFERALTPYDKKIAEVYAEYQKRLTGASALDFDDLLTSAVYLFRSHPEVASGWRAALRPRAGRRVPGHQRGAVGARADPGRGAPQYHGGGRRRPGDLPVPGGRLPQPACGSRRRSPTPRSSSWSRTTAPPRRSSTPPTPSSPTTPGAGPSTCGPTPSAAS